jgi:hypothetical protein
MPASSSWRIARWCTLARLSVGAAVVGAGRPPLARSMVRTTKAAIWSRVTGAFGR